MKKKELREMIIIYCDVCGKECEGGYSTFNDGTPEEKHACHVWNEAEQTRCDLKMQATLNKRPSTSVAHTLADFVAQ